eukprot:CAMPEP_0118951868 /NCGR_PEP_ID=MMETSP1169-20130426/53846_1 /TAXON_ID=36882 /ORGANISM="Pyramimonas obovata, Strain CCMP722" /LENGTH=39 /DNA_ID= /DNA_START= /DNA_END= /DNA_ORIENTATION=
MILIGWCNTGTHGSGDNTGDIHGSHAGSTHGGARIHDGA